MSLRCRSERASAALPRGVRRNSEPSAIYEGLREQREHPRLEDARARVVLWEHAGEAAGSEVDRDQPLRQERDAEASSEKLPASAAATNIRMASSSRRAQRVSSARASSSTRSRARTC